MFSCRVFFAAVFLLLPGSLRGQVVGFEDVSILPASFVNNQPFTSGGVAFNNFVDPMFGSWAGFAASRVTDITTPDFTNQYSAYSPTGGGDASAQYAVGYYSEFFNFSPRLTLPAGMRPLSVRVTNTTFAYFTMLNGNQFAKKFGGPTGDDPDFFRLIVTGFDDANAVTGSTEFLLADFRFANNAQDYIVNDWTTLDLTPLGAARSVQFGFESSDVGPFGINTPTYMAIDNLTITVVPEPSSLALVGLAVAGGWRVSRRRK